MYALLRYELTLAVRQKWVPIGAAIFAVLGGAMAVAGLSADAEIGVHGFGRTTAALLNLTLLLVPMLGLLLGATHLCRERDNWEPFLVQPVNRNLLVLARLGGVALALTVALGLGFGAVGSIIGLRVGWGDVGTYWILVAVAWALGLSMVALGGLIAALARGRTQAITVALGCWFSMALLYDLAIVVMTVATRGAALRGGLLALIAANPVDLARIAAIVGLGAETSLGPGGALLLHTTESWAPYALCGGLLAWIVVPALLAMLLFRRMEI